MATALTAPKTLRTRGGSGQTDAFPVASGVTIYNGSLVWYDNTVGRITSTTPTSTDLTNKRYDFLGIAIPSTNSVLGVAAIADTPMCPVSTGGVIVEGVNVLGADVEADGGNAVYARSNDMLDADGPSDATTGTSLRAIGYICRWNSAADQDVQLFDSSVSKSLVTTYHNKTA